MDAASMLKNKAEISIRNPKRDTSNRKGRASWYPYYAGYSLSFVEDALRFTKSRIPNVRVLDPWNGSGITTQAAQAFGMEAEGYDLNPSMIIVAKAKTLGRNVCPSLSSLADDICVKANKECDISPGDPLSRWFGRQSTSAIRTIEKSIFMLLIARDKYSALGKWSTLKDVSALAAFFYVALFRVVRKFTRPFSGSNPTWIKNAETAEDLLDVPFAEIARAFREEVLWMSGTISKETIREVVAAPPVIELAHSTELPGADERFDAAISSPPYCTRIDYPIKTRPELAVMGLDDNSLRKLRDKMLGTPTISNTPAVAAPKWGESCCATLNTIRRHRSYASESYYWKTYIQYFDGLSKSLRQIARVLRPTGLCFLVVQDSFYKDVFIDLAQISIEMGRNVNLHLVLKKQFRNSRTMLGINSTSRAYNNAHESVETVLVLQKGVQSPSESTHA